MGRFLFLYRGVYVISPGHFPVRIYGQMILLMTFYILVNYMAYLLGEEFGRERVKGDEFHGYAASFDKAFRHKHVLADRFEVGPYHSTRPVAKQLPRKRRNKEHQ